MQCNQANLFIRKVISKMENYNSWFIKLDEFSIFIIFWHWQRIFLSCFLSRYVRLYEIVPLQAASCDWELVSHLTIRSVRLYIMNMSVVTNGPWITFSASYFSSTCLAKYSALIGWKEVTCCDLVLLLAERTTVKMSPGWLGENLTSTG